MFGLFYYHSLRKNYQVLFFDLDHTLWDFDSNSRETLLQLFEEYDLGKHQLFSISNFIDTYIENNHILWREYHLGKITKYELRKTRFKKTFSELGLNENLIPKGFEDDYVKICPTKTNVFPKVYETLEYLKSKDYKMHIITNGFHESSTLKLGNTDLRKYFDHIFISEILGISKPDIKIFNFAMKTAQSNLDNSIMIGDSLEADIVGAQDSGMDTVFFNPIRKPHSYKPTFEIKEIVELKKIL